MARKEFTSIPVERPQLEQLQAAKEQMQEQAGRTLRWGDVFTALLAFRDQAFAGDGEPSGVLMAEMRQDGHRALTPAELEAMGVELLPGLPMTLSDDDCERIADLVVDKLLKRLPGLPKDKPRGRSKR